MSDIRNSTATVAIGCKLPNGLVMEIPEPAPGRQHLPGPIGLRYTLNGANSKMIRTPFGPVAQGSFRYGITHVPKDFADKWFERYKDMQFVKRGQVFVVQDEQRAVSAAKERENDSQTRTGLEPLEEKDSRLPKGVARKKDEAAAA